MVYAKIKTLTRKPGGNRDIAIKDRSGKLVIAGPHGSKNTMEGVYRGAI